MTEAWQDEGAQYAKTKPPFQEAASRITFSTSVSLTQADIDAMGLTWYKNIHSVDRLHGAALERASLCLTYTKDRRGVTLPRILPLYEVLEPLGRCGALTIGLYNYRLGGHNNMIISRSRSLEAYL